MKQAAYEAASVAYCNALCGMTPPSNVAYDGAFDIAALVSDAPKPSRPELCQHQACWAEFRRMFHLRWAQHESEVE